MSEWFTFDEEYEKAKEDACKYLTHRERTEQEVKDHLVGKGYSEVVVQRVTLKLREWEYIDDCRYCRLWLKNRIGTRGKGSAFLKNELLSKGIAEDLIEDILSAEYDLGREHEVAYELAVKKVNSCQGTPGEIKAKLWRYLAQRGFSSEIIEEVLNRVLTE